MEKTFVPLASARGRTDLRRYNNDWYQPGPRWKIALWFVINALFLNSYLLIPNGIKIRLLSWFGAKIGSQVVIKPGVNIKYPWLLSIGSNVWIGERVWIDNLAAVVIGDNVCLSQGAMLLTGNHDYRQPTFDLIVKPITLEEGVWIGAKSVVCPGVQARSHAVLAVGSVATQDMIDYTIYQGNPAVAVRNRQLTA